MKRIVYLVLKQLPNAFPVLETIKQQGYNATIMSTESLRHMVDEIPEGKHFFGLRNFEQMTLQESIFCMFVIDEDRLGHLKQVIRETTKNFTLVKGFMFSHQIEDYEGSI